MNKCCICNSDIQEENAATLCVSSDGEEKLLCANCEKFAQYLFDGGDEDNQEEGAQYFASYLSKIKDDEVKAVIQNQLDETGYKTQKQINAESKQNDRVTRSWISLVKSLVTVDIIFGILASIAIGVIVIGKVSAFLGVVLIAVGILFSVLSSAIIMIFLNMAENINSIKMSVEQK